MVLRGPSLKIVRSEFARSLPAPSGAVGSLTIAGTQSVARIPSRPGTSNGRLPEALARADIAIAKTAR